MSTTAVTMLTTALAMMVDQSNSDNNANRSIINAGRQKQTLTTALTILVDTTQQR